MTATAVRVLMARTGMSPADLRCEQVPPPIPGPEDVLVAVHASAVTRSDALSVSGAMPMTTFPRVPGRDFAGVVVSGPEVPVGTRVWGAGGRELGFTVDGTHAELVAVPVTAAAAIPESMSFDEAAASASAYFTAHEALVRADAEGDTAFVLITGAVGAVGTAVTCLAHHRGARVIGAVRGPEEREYARSLPFHAVADTDTDDLLSVVLSATEGAGVDAAVDTVGGPLLSPVLACLAQCGSACVISSAPGSPLGFDVLEFYRKELRLTGLNTGRSDCRRAGEILRSLAPLFESGELQVPRVAARYPLTDAATAYQAVLAGAAGRVLLLPQT